MSKRVYISADYSENSGDRDVVAVLRTWGTDKQHITDFVDTAQVASGSVSNNADCRACDLKLEFNSQIRTSSAVIFVVGDKTASRSAGSSCSRAKNLQAFHSCTPYKQNANGEKSCKRYTNTLIKAAGDVNAINAYSYLQHEFEEAKRCNKKIIIVYNALTKQPHWLPDYMRAYESIAQPFWFKNYFGNKVGNYAFIKKELGYV